MKKPGHLCRPDTVSDNNLSIILQHFLTAAFLTLEKTLLQITNDQPGLHRVQHQHCWWSFVEWTKKKPKQRINILSVCGLKRINGKWMLKRVETLVIITNHIQLLRHTAENIWSAATNDEIHAANVTVASNYNRRCSRVLAFSIHISSWNLCIMLWNNTFPIMVTFLFINIIHTQTLWFSLMLFYFLPSVAIVWLKSAQKACPFWLAQFAMCSSLIGQLRFRLPEKSPVWKRRQLIVSSF